MNDLPLPQSILAQNARAVDAFNFSHWHELEDVYHEDAIVSLANGVRYVGRAAIITYLTGLEGVEELQCRVIDAVAGEDISYESVQLRYKMGPESRDVMINALQVLTRGHDGMWRIRAASYGNPINPAQLIH